MHAVGEHTILETPVWIALSYILLLEQTLFPFIPSFLFIFSVTQHEAHLSKDGYRSFPPGFIWSLFSLCLVIVSFAATWLLLGFHAVAESSLWFPSFCFALSSASSQSPAADPRKSCCFSVLAYVIPTYSYVILCNVFAAVATLKTISLPVRLYAEMNRVKRIVLTANERKCVCYYHKGIC